jgi:hypothetical protein
MAEGTPLEIIGPGARRDRNIRPSNGVALAHFNANCGRPPWTTAAPLPSIEGENEKHRRNDNEMGAIACINTTNQVRRETAGALSPAQTLAQSASRSRKPMHLSSSAISIHSLAV